ncbi:MAG TPA: YtxH domain-containing protein [Candidatus Saccharimonadales bacterium]|jgi:gas vesicle protein
MDDNRPTTKKDTNVMGVALVAAAVGAAAGLLLAPKRGTEMRQDLKGKYNGMKNKTQDVAHSTRDKVTQGVDTAKSKIHMAADKTADRTRDMADRTKDMADKASDKTKDAATKTAPETSLADEIAAAERSKRGRSSL